MFKECFHKVKFGNPDVLLSGNLSKFICKHFLLNSKNKQLFITGKRICQFLPVSHFTDTAQF